MQVLQLVLSHGDGLVLGPDSDGLLNYCDAGRPGLSLQQAPEEGGRGRGTIRCVGGREREGGAGSSTTAMLAAQDSVSPLHRGGRQ